MQFIALFVFWLVPLFVDYCTYTATVLCTFLAFTTSTSVRTEPQATSAAPEEKSNYLLAIIESSIYVRSLVAALVVSHH